MLKSFDEKNIRIDQTVNPNRPSVQSITTPTVDISRRRACSR